MAVADRSAGLTTSAPSSTRRRGRRRTRSRRTSQGPDGSRSIEGNPPEAWSPTRRPHQVISTGGESPLLLGRAGEVVPASETTLMGCLEHRVLEHQANRDAL